MVFFGLFCLGFLFILALIPLVIYLQKDNFLEKLPLLPGEVTLFDDENCTFESVSQRRSKSTRYMKGYVRVTNYRILCAQQDLVGKLHYLRLVISYVPQALTGRPTNYFASALQKGHHAFTMTPGSALWEQNGDVTSFFIPDPEGGKGVRLKGVRFYPSKIAHWKQIFS